MGLFWIQPQHDISNRYKTWHYVCSGFNFQVHGNSKISHWKVGKIILTYNVGTTNFDIMYSTTNSSSQVGYTHNDFVGALMIGRELLGNVFNLGLYLMSWESTKKPIMTISSIKE